MKECVIEWKPKLCWVDAVNIETKDSINTNRTSRRWSTTKILNDKGNGENTNVKVKVNSSRQAKPLSFGQGNGWEHIFNKTPTQLPPS